MYVCVSEKEGVKKCTVIFFAWSKVCGKASDSAFGVRHSTRERSNSRQKLEDDTIAGNLNVSNL